MSNTSSLSWQNAINVATRAFDYSKQFMPAVPYVSAIIGIHASVYAAVMAGLIEKDSLRMRAVRVVGALIRLIINIVRLIASIPLVGVVLSIITAIERMINVGIAIYKRTVSLFKNENEIRQSNGIIAENSHLLAIAAISVASAVLFALSFNVIGGIIFAGVMLYTALEAFDINPLRWLANKLFHHPFAEAPASPKPAYVNDKEFGEKESGVASSKKVYQRLAIRPIPKDGCSPGAFCATGSRVSIGTVPGCEKRTRATTALNDGVYHAQRAVM